MYTLYYMSRGINSYLITDTSTSTKTVWTDKNKIFSSKFCDNICDRSNTAITIATFETLPKSWEDFETGYPEYFI